jgi:hypothetical protein
MVACSVKASTSFNTWRWNIRLNVTGEIYTLKPRLVIAHALRHVWEIVLSSAEGGMLRMLHARFWTRRSYKCADFKAQNRVSDLCIHNPHAIPDTCLGPTVQSRYLYTAIRYRDLAETHSAGQQAFT